MFCTPAPYVPGAGCKTRLINKMNGFIYGSGVSGSAASQITNYRLPNQIINQNVLQATSGFEMCFTPRTFGTFGAGSQRSQPKHVSNPDSVMKKFDLGFRPVRVRWYWSGWSAVPAPYAPFTLPARMVECRTRTARPSTGHLHATCTPPARHLHATCTPPARHLHAW